MSRVRGILEDSMPDVVLGPGIGGGGGSRLAELLSETSGVGAKVRDEK
jgi:hypothetical protein